MGVPVASAEKAAAPLEPVVGVVGLFGGAESGVTAAGPLEQVVGDRGSHGGASGMRQAALETENQQAPRRLAQLQAQHQAIAASAIVTAATPRLEECSVPPSATPAVTELMFPQGASGETAAAPLVQVVETKKKDECEVGEIRTQYQRGGGGGGGQKVIVFLNTVNCTGRLVRCLGLVVK